VQKSAKSVAKRVANMVQSAYKR